MTYILVWILFLRLFVAGSTPVGRTNLPALENTDSQLVEMTITGETNINRFNLYLNLPARVNPASLVSGKINAGLLTFHIPVSFLDCQNKSLLHDFRKMVNAAEYPVVSIGIDTGKFEEIVSGGGRSPVPLQITLSGITKKLHSHYSIQPVASGQQILTGDVTIRLSDFSMKPPQKMFGLIKLNDEVIINFKISIKTA